MLTRNSHMPIQTRKIPTPYTTLDPLLNPSRPSSVKNITPLTQPTTARLHLCATAFTWTWLPTLGRNSSKRAKLPSNVRGMLHGNQLLVVALDGPGNSLGASSLSSWRCRRDWSWPKARSRPIKRTRSVSLGVARYKQADCSYSFSHKKVDTQ